jgi:prophage regulatory protein
MAITKQAQHVIGITLEGPGAPVGSLIRGWRGVCRKTGKSRVQLWRDIRNGRFPAPIEIGPNSVAWHEVEVEAWLAARPRRTYGAPVPPATAVATA